jgi:CMP-N-acetylneuraminic acid synthetase
MLNEKRILALIPSRAGSKRLPGKNLLRINGQSLLARSIRTARACKLIDRIVVSTEDNRIAREAVRCGASVPFMRPRRLASDQSTTMDVVLNALHMLDKQNQRFDILILLQPTSPLRTQKHIAEALHAFERRHADAVVSVTPAANNYFWTGRLPDTLCMNGFMKYGNAGIGNKQSYFTLNGAIYISRIDVLKRRRSWYSKKTFAYVMDRACSVDIDTQEDFLLAKAILTHY